MKRKSGVGIHAELTSLVSLDYTTLKDKWHTLYGVPAPKKISADFLQLAIGYGIQEKAFGGLKPKVRRQLMRLARADPSATTTEVGRSQYHTQPTTLRPGIRLVREWNGETHMVEVVDGGFLWRGRPYTSLSAIAKAITGAHWSGPRFFALKGRPAEVSHR